MWSNKPKTLGVALANVTAAVAAAIVRKAEVEIVSDAALRTAIVVSSAVDLAIGRVSALIKKEIVAAVAVHAMIIEAAETARVVVAAMMSMTVNGVTASASAVVRRVTRKVADSYARIATETAVVVADAAVPLAGVVVASAAAGDATAGRPQWTETMGNGETTDARPSSATIVVMTTTGIQRKAAAGRPKRSSTMKNRTSLSQTMVTNFCCS